MLWKKTNEECFWFQVAVRNVPRVLSVLALDLPAFNTRVDKNLFIWILSAKKLPRLAEQSAEPSKGSARENGERWW